MKKLFIPILFQAALAVGMAQIDQKALLVIDRVNVIPMTGEVILENQRVVIQGNEIIELGPSDSEMSNKGATLIDGRGKYLMPGFSEMHYHWRNREGGIQRDFNLMLAHGITTARNMGEYDWQDQITIRDQVRSGDLFGPNYYTTGPYLKAENLADSRTISETVRNHLNRGYDFIKLADNLPQEQFLALIDEAGKAGIPVIGHGQREMPLKFSVKMRSIEHVEEFVYIYSDKERVDPLFLQASLRQIAQSGVTIAPTLVVFKDILRYLDDPVFKNLPRVPEAKYMLAGDYDYWVSEDNPYRKDLKGKNIKGREALPVLREYFEWMMEYTRLLHKEGVPLMTGSDTFGFTVPGISLHREFELLNKAGMSPYQILKASTVIPARYLGREKLEGTVEIGKQANLVLLEDNPLEDIRNSRKISGVILRGRWIDRSHINRMLEEVQKLGPFASGTQSH
ncbi:amidohydrolase family protein [Robiginitalea biformata]|uniref:Amidohydrolase family enzyme n=1 Tax=Robiginitalea biformata (strain ATCC BAA-864 / DSM 15991 / KCTC 12146 / HTCC2501) TaxID=313596 RepID=A4CMC8_ROBBH|nr:amidohydrolase family protein [Robiginitalea biformata]EAR14820.1 Amidohydrolase family enzyme [Robiginitalea biformata HTCC2501]